MALQPNTLLQNRYRILRALGQGGMGAVYLAEDTNLPGHQVAVKENSDHSQIAQDQFRREALILARLQNAHLPKVSDHFVLPSGEQYLVMEFVPGDDLEQILRRRGPLPESEVLGWMDQVLDALEYMHNLKDLATGTRTPVIHRDIKPANIKLTPHGKIMLVDFGIAKLQGSSGTLKGAQACTPGFSPPEQHTMSGTDERSDIYALGATIYCLLTNQVPPDAFQLFTSQTRPIPPRLLVPRISRRTEDSILRAMEIRPADRFASARDFRQAVFSSRHSTAPSQVFPSHSPSTPPSMACPRCNTRNRLQATFCQACGYSFSGPSPIIRPVSAPKPYTPTAAPVVQPRSRRPFWPSAALVLAVLIVPVLVGAAALWRSMERSKDQQAAAAEAEFVATLSGQIALPIVSDGWQDIYVLDLGSRKLQRLTASAEPDAAPSWAPDASRLVYSSDRSGDTELFMIKRDGQNERQLGENKVSDEYPKWSPDGQLILFGSNPAGYMQSYVMKADGTGERSQLTGGNADNWLASWSPDGRSIVFASDRGGDYDIYTMSASGALQTQLTDNRFADKFPVWSPNGRRIALMSERDNNYEIYVMDVDGGNQTRLTDTASFDGYPVWSPDGQRIAFISDRDGTPGLYVMSQAGQHQMKVGEFVVAEGPFEWTK